MKKPEIIVSVSGIDEVENLISAGADGFVIQVPKFSLMGGKITHIHEIEKIVTKLNENQKKKYLLVDAIFPNDLLVELENFLNVIKNFEFDAIRVADLGAFMLIKKILPQMVIHFVDAMMLTNYFTVNYWGNKGVKRVRLAHELTLEEVLNIKKSASTEIEVLVHGAPLMFTSRRKLIDNYLTFKKTLGKDVTLSTDASSLFDEERNLFYPIHQNEHGTHIHGGTDVIMVDDLIDLVSVGIDAIYIEGLTYSNESFVNLIQLYRYAIDLIVTDREKYLKISSALYRQANILQQNRSLDRGFYYKPTIYKNKDEEV